MTLTGTSQTRPTSRDAAGRPRIIQGGMGVAISGWRLARAVSMTGQLGVVSGTAVDVVCARRLQDGDPGGHIRRALAAFPVPEVAQRIIDTYFVDGGIPADAPYRPVLRHTLSSAPRLVELTVAANFVEVYLAKEGHDGLVGMNYLRKIELPLPAGCYGAILAGVDYFLVGAGSPAEIPELVRRLSRHEPVTMAVKVMGARSTDNVGGLHFDPRGVVPNPPPVAAPPQVLAIIASSDLATGLAGDPGSRPDGFVVEGPLAGGHNAPPRGPRQVDEVGQPVYGERDVVDIPSIVALGLPVWLAGAQASPEGLRAAISLGAVGIQAGTVFAYSDESGFDPALKQQLREGVERGDLTVRADWRVSPTGFPFRVAELPGTLSDTAVVAERQPVCDLGVLRTAYLKPNGDVDYRCPAEPATAYLRKGGREVNREGRVCLCNALLASAGLPQRRPNGFVEPPLATSGSDVSPVVTLLRRRPVDAPADEPPEHPLGHGYTAAQAVDYVLGTVG